MRETADTSVGKEFKAVAQDVLRLGAQCVQAGRVWLNDRREEMTNRNDEFRRDNPSIYGRQNQNPQNPNMQNQNLHNQNLQNPNLQGQRYQGQDSYGQQTSRYSQPYGGSDYEGYGSQASGSYQQERYQGDFEGGQRLQGSQGRGYQEQQFTGQIGERSPWDEGRGFGEPGRYEPGRYASSEYGQRILGAGYRQQELMGQNLGGRYGQGYGTSSGYGQSDYGYGQSLGNQGLGAGGSSYGYRDEGEMSGYRLQGQSTYGTGSLGNRTFSNVQTYRGRGPKNYTRSDERIIDDINERLTNDDDIDASEIEVKCVQGVVTLEGSVEERWMKHRAEDIADSCSGVRQVENRLTVESISSLDTEGRQGTSTSKTGSQTQSRSGTQSGKPGSSGSAH